MPYAELEPPQSGSKSLDVKMSARLTKKGATICLTIPAFVLERIGAKASDKFQIALGSGEDAGTLRLLKDKNGKWSAREFKGTVVFRLGVTAFSPAAAQARTDLEWDTSGTSTLILDLPAWARRPKLEVA